VTLRQQLAMLEKKEEYLLKKIDEELKKAKANAVSNKPGELVFVGLGVDGLVGGGCCDWKAARGWLRVITAADEGVDIQEGTHNLCGWYL